MTNLKFRTVQTIIILMLVFSLPKIGLSQSNLNVLQQNVENADYVVEGKIISKESFRDSRNGEILTTNKVLITTNIKGNDTETISIVTKGGTIDGETVSLSHVVKLGLEEYGIFLLRKGSYFTILNGHYGKIKKLFNDPKSEGYYEGTHQKYQSWRQLKEQIGEWSNIDLTIDPINDEILKSLEVSPELCIQIANVVPSIPNSQIEFDLLIKSDVAGLPFASREIIMDYPIAHLGVNIVLNNKITVQKEVVTMDDDYVMSVEDVTTDKLRINFETSCTFGDNYYILGTEFEKIAHIILDVQTWGDQGTMYLDNLQGGAKYFLGKNGCQDFTDFCLGGEIGFVACEALTAEVAPFAAGKGQVLTITGTELGSGILGQIDIPNPDDGGDTDISIFSIDPDFIIDWDDDEIQINLSSIAPGNHPMGSGTWWINPDFTQGNILKCPVDIEIDYALLNSQVNSVDRMISLAKNPGVAGNPDGTIEWYIDNGINADSLLQAQGITFDMVREVAEQAFCDWENATGIDFRYMGPLVNANNNVNDGFNALFFADLDDDKKAITRTSFNDDLCDDDDLYFGGRLVETDIRFDRGTQWHVSLNENGILDLEYDFYSVLMHEIGHSLCLQHAMDMDNGNGTSDTRLMYYKILDEQIKRGIDDDSDSGVELLVQRTQESINTPDECFFNFYVIDTNIEDCGGINNITDIANFQDCIYPAKTVVTQGENIQIRLNDSANKRLTIFSAFGQVIYSREDLIEGDIEIGTEKLSSGVYFLQYFCDGIQNVKRIVIH